MNEILNLLVCAYFGVTALSWIYLWGWKTDSNKAMAFFFPLAWPLVIIFAIGISCYAVAMEILKKCEPNSNKHTYPWRG